MGVAKNSIIYRKGILIMSEDNKRSKEEILNEVRERLNALQNGDLIQKKERYERIYEQHKLARTITILSSMKETIEEKGWSNLSDDVKSLIKEEAKMAMDHVEKVERKLQAMRDHPNIEEKLSS